ncbi:MAG TPA: dihydroorotase family protein [Candidatus Dormibacteraeota bacterium]|nr:dihydroorotase family protein [Candidatus Dormibacteraeota bacterium]
MRIRGATVYTPQGPVEADVRVDMGTIIAVGDEASTGEDPEEIDGGGLWLLPGAVDAHVHSRDPGLPEKEDFRSLTAAAAAGGVTTVVDMPNTIPAVDTDEVFWEKAADVAQRASVDFALWGVVRSSAAEADLRGLAVAGAVGIKAYLGYALRRENRQITYTLDLGDPGLEAPPDYGTLARCAPLLAELGLPLAVHAEDPGILREFARPADSYAEVLASRPALAEAVAVAALDRIARATGCTVHIVHLSSRAGLDAAWQALAASSPMILETCSQYLWCTDEDVERIGPWGKMYPPIRTADDRDALREGLREGVIDRVATDHAPHEDAEKSGRSWGEAAAGSPGVQTLYISCLELARRWGDPALAVRWVAEAPARSLRIWPRKGGIQVGADADLVLVDPRAETRMEPRMMRSRQVHGLFEGQTFPFRVRAVWSRGRLVARDGEPLPASGHGRLVRPA